MAPYQSSQRDDYFSTSSARGPKKLTLGIMSMMRMAQRGSVPKVTALNRRGKTTLNASRVLGDVASGFICSHLVCHGDSRPGADSAFICTPAVYTQSRASSAEDEIFRANLLTSLADHLDHLGFGLKAIHLPPSSAEDEIFKAKLRL